MEVGIISYFDNRIREPMASVLCRIGMSSYIPNHEKKNRIFAKRVRNLVHALKNDFAREKITALAEKVREAKMGVFKCRFAESAKPHTFSPEEMAANNEQVQNWVSMSTTDIIELYQTKHSQ